jgi:hypothetical protein
VGGAIRPQPTAAFGVTRAYADTVPDDPGGTFRTHSNYLRSFAHIAGFTNPYERQPTYRLRKFGERVMESPSLTRLRAQPSEVDQVESSLANAWGTELLLALTGEYAVEDELIKLGNSWGVVQAYYALYHAFQALAVARGHPRPDTHAKTQKSFASFWAERRLELSPWTLAASHQGYLNVPADVAVDESFHPWRRCDKDTRWHLAAKGLRTTREEAVGESFARARDRKAKERRRSWELEERERVAKGLAPRRTPAARRPNLLAAERKQLSAAVRPHTILDYLYRLRVKANYEDASVFTVGPDSEYASRTVHTDLKNIVSAGLLLHELHIRELIGGSRFRSLVTAWLGSTMPRDTRLGLAIRAHVHDRLC